MNNTNLFDIFTGAPAATIAAACRLMQQHNLSPADVLAQYDDYIRTQTAGQVPPPPEAFADPDTPRQTAQQKTGLEREFPAGPCPRCGQQTFAHPLCPHVSPIWRTELACGNPDCTWDGRSKLPLAVLKAQWPGDLVDTEPGP